LEPELIVGGLPHGIQFPVKAIHPVLYPLELNLIRGSLGGEGLEGEGAKEKPGR
jgi:hypothetical protein